MNIDFYSYSGIGGRTVNEDSAAYGKDYFVVSDGLGGHDNGEIASRAAVNCISENFDSDISDESISRLLLGADEAVKQSGRGGKATIAALFTDGSEIRIANIGDSRVYYFRRGSVYFRTKDHSVCQASVDMGEMTDNEVRSSADRSGLFKVLGDTQPLKLPKPYDTIDPLDGDAFLICSDGFWEHVYDMEMEADLLKSENARDWLTHMLKRLLLRSENNGDNFTAICGIIHAPDKLPPTMSITDNAQTMEIPITAELTERAAMPFKNKLIIICCAAVMTAAIVIIAVLLITGIKNGVSDTEQQSEQSSTENNHSDETYLPALSGLPVVSDTSDISDIPETSDAPEITMPPESSVPPEITVPPESSVSPGITVPPEPTEPPEPSEPPEPPEPSGITEIPGINLPQA